MILSAKMIAFRTNKAFKIKELYSCIIVLTKQFNEETSFENVPKFWNEYYEKGYQKVVPPMLCICINSNESLEFEYGIASLK